MCAKSSSNSESPAGSRPRTVQSADAGLALDKLSAAFAQMLSSGSDPYGQSAGSEAIIVDEEPLQESSGEQLSAHEDRSEANDEACEITPRSILEAMLF